MSDLDLLDWLDAGPKGGRSVPHADRDTTRQLYRLRREGLVYRQHKTESPAAGRWWMTARRWAGRRLR